MGSFFQGAGLFALAAVLFFLGNRLHKKSAGGQGAAKGAKPKKIIATIMSFCSGLAMLGTIVGDWLGDLAGMSPYIAAAFFLVSAGIVFIDWWSDGVPDRPAFLAAAFLPLAVVVGFTQLDRVGDMLGENADRVTDTIKSQSR